MRPRRAIASADPHAPHVGLVLWNGNIGGAEVFTVSLAASLRRQGVDAEVIFVADPKPLCERVSSSVRFRSLGFRRGRELALHPRRYASMVASAGCESVLLVDCGLMGAALRAGGFRGRIVAVEHGALLGVPESRGPRRLLRALSRAAGAWANDLEVAVSDFVLADMTRRPHAALLTRVYNGIDVARYQTDADSEDIEAASRPCAIGFAGRLVPGKGVECLIRATARLSSSDIRVHVAGDGPERSKYEALARTLGVSPLVTFHGLIDDLPGFWRGCDVAVTPSAEFVESCPMTVLEAMAAGRPVVATENGGLPELVVNGRTGTLVAPRDVDGLAAALDAYAADPALRASHGRGGAHRVATHFDLESTAREYGALLDTRPSSREASS